MSALATIRLPSERTAVAHRTVEEIWFITAGRGEMWRKQGEREETISLEPGVCLTIPLGTHFQFRASSTEGVSAIGVTMPPWPGEGEAVSVAGPWPAAKTYFSISRQQLTAIEGILAHVHAGRIMDERKRKANLRDHGFDFADERVHVISFQRATRHDERFLFKSL